MALALYHTLVYCQRRLAVPIVPRVRGQAWERITGRPMRNAMAKPASKPRTPPDSARLTRDDWLDAAFRAVVDGGFDKVRVLLLADALGVTRGSFYWHFADHAALVSALLARWREREQATNRALALPASDDPRRDLELLLESALAHAGADLENMRFELALRGLGRRDPAVAEMLADVDAQRMALFHDKFLRYTGDAEEGRATWRRCSTWPSSAATRR